MSNIDWDFIKKLEGNSLTGVVPDAEGSQSGVTIASGFDLGARGLSDLSGLPQDIIDLLTPYLGYKGAEAQEIAGNLKVSDDQANIINEFSKSEATSKLSQKWKEKTGQDFSDLPKNKATVIASVAFQYGDLATKAPNFWRQVTSDDWDGAIKNLRDFKDSYGSRRNLEADFFEAGSKKKSELTNQQLVEQAQEKIVESKKVGTEAEIATGQTIVADRIDTSEIGEEGGLGTEPTAEPFIQTEEIDTFEQSVFAEELSPQQVPSFGTEPVEVETAEDSYYIKSMKRANEPVDYFWKDVPKSRSKTDVINELVEKDIQFNGHVSEFIKGDQFGLAAPMLFMEGSQVWESAFRQYNPILAARDVITDMMHAVDDDPEYDFASDPQLKNNKDSMWRFSDSRSSVETARRLENLNQERADMEVLSSSDSFGVELGAALVSPSTLTPVAPLKYMKQASRLKRFGTGAAFTGGTVGLEQGIVSEARETRDAVDALKATAIGVVVGGSVNSLLGARMANSQIARTAAREKKAEELYGDGGFYRSAGASVNPEILRKQAYDTIEQDALKETGIGLEKVRWNPVTRGLLSKNPLVRGIVSEIVDLGGMMQKKVDDEVATTQSVERKFTAKYIGPLVQALQEGDKAYLAYRGVVAREGDIGRSFQMFGLAVKDKISRPLNYLTEIDFKIRVGKALRNGDVDTVTDAASDAVNKSASAARKQFNFIADEAVTSKLFETQIRKQLKAAIASGMPQSRIDILRKRLERTRAEGVFLNNAKSYAPRLYRVDKIMANIPKFRKVIGNYARSELGLSGDALKKYVDNVFDSVTRSKPYMAVDEGIDNLEEVMTAGSSKSREIDIPDHLIEDFLENDYEVLLRHHTKTMGTDIEFQRAFGSVDMAHQIGEITTEWRRLIDETTDPIEKAKMEKELLSDLKDIRGLRDRVRGTYGASKDPHAMSSRFVRAMKSFNVLVGMGGATVSSIPDLARTAMVEGFKTTYEKGLKNGFRNNSKALKGLKKREMLQAGVAADALLGLRASAFSNVGDLFGNRTVVEQALNQSTGVMFLLNGLNMYNQLMKEFAGGVTTLRMTEHIMKPWNTLSKSSKNKFLKNGIDEQMHGKMQELIKKNGEQVDGEWMPNTELWDNVDARVTFRVALGQQVDRIIVTPGAGDRALWTSTEFGSLLTQFKSYGQSATIRVLTSGLQEKDASFWQGALLMVGLGAMVNEIKRAQYGMDRKESFNEKLINAVERSGVTGMFFDLDNVVEKLSNNHYGTRAMLTDQRKYPMPLGAKAAAVAGPAASTVSNFTSVMNDVLTGKADQGTLNTLGFLTPFRNHPAADPFFDKLYNQ